MVVAGVAPRGSSDWRVLGVPSAVSALDFDPGMPHSRDSIREAFKVDTAVAVALIVKRAEVVWAGEKLQPWV